MSVSRELQKISCLQAVGLSAQIEFGSIWRMLLRIDSHGKTQGFLGHVEIHMCVCGILSKLNSVLFLDLNGLTEQTNFVYRVF